MKTIKNTLNLTSLFLICLLLVIGCKKEILDLNENENYSLVKDDTKEYFIADLEGFDGLNKMNYQDSDGFEFEQKSLCSSIKMQAYNSSTHKYFSLYFSKESGILNLSELLEIGDYIVGYKRYYSGYVKANWYSMEFRDHTGFGEIKSLPSFPDEDDPEKDYYEDQKFRISKIKEVDGALYAIGTFYMEFQSTGRTVDGVYQEYKQNFRMTNGIFKFRIN